MLRQPDPLAERKCLSFEQAEGIAPAAESPGTQSDFTGVYRSLPEFTGVYRSLPEFTGVYRSFAR